MRKKFLSVAMTMVISGSTLLAANAGATETVSLNQMANVQIVPSTDAIDEWIGNVRKSFNIPHFGESGGRYFFSATQATSVNPPYSPNNP